MFITICGKEYELRFDFEATEYKDFVDRMFKMVTASYIAEETENASSETVAMINGGARMVSELPETCKMAFYAGLIHYGTISVEDSYELLKAYVKENKLSWLKLYQSLRDAMEEDGFFDLTGMTEFLQMTEEVEAQKIPQDHKKSNRGRKTTTNK